MGPHQYYSAKRVLLVEDSHSSAMLVQSIFAEADEQAGRAEVLHVESLEAALAFAADPASPRVDVVLLDLTLPDSQGLETLIRFREADPDSAVVVLTGTADEALAMRALGLGAQDFLFKDETYPRLLIRQSNYAAQRRRQERALVAAKEQAEESTRLKERFVSMVSHDLRGPLGGINGVLEMLADPNDAMEREEVVDLAASALASGRNLLQVVEQLLDISRLRTGKISPKPTFFDGHYLAREVIDRLAPAAREKGLTLVNQVPTESRLYADRALFAQVIQNLVGNAIKFSRSGERIRLYLPDGRPTTLAVQDKGVGIPPESQAKLFCLDAKVSTPGTAGEAGTGFGLPYSHDIMEAHGGGLSVESTPDVGSRFFARLPERRPRVLVVDDNAAMRAVLRAPLEEIGAEVEELGDGRLALDRVRAGEAVDLLISDLEMPELDGFGLLEALRRNPASEGLPVIVVTGDDALASRERALGLGADDFTVKPVSLADFVPRVRRFIA